MSETKKNEKDQRVGESVQPVRRSSRIAATRAVDEVTTCVSALSVKRARVSKGSDEGKNRVVKSDQSVVVSSPLMQMELRLWEQGKPAVVGVDEAGRGPLAGPVVCAACCILDGAEGLENIVLDDSKNMTEEEREAAFAFLTTPNPKIHYSVSIVSHEEIDALNILRASLEGMDRALEAVAKVITVDAVAVDGPHLPPRMQTVYGENVRPVIGGDAKVRCIAAASVLAKVTRDRIMMEMDTKYPGYGFAKHKGYPVPVHREALQRLGPCAIHRTSYDPVRRALEARGQAIAVEEKTKETKPKKR